MHFDEKWKFKAHKKTCKQYSCDQCDKIYKTENTHEKHTKIAHEQIKIYCHYFNNEKPCPYNEECIFIHEKTDVCKYGENCGRTLCMFQHEESEDSSDSDDEDSSDNDENECNQTFINPSIQLDPLIVKGLADSLKRLSERTT